MSETESTSNTINLGFRKDRGEDSPDDLAQD